MRRTYADNSAFRAPFTSVPFQGLGAGFPGPGSRWPAGRAYMDPSQFRAPYNEGYYQSGALRGLGAAPAAIAVPGAGSYASSSLPPAVQQWLEGGAAIPSWPRDLGALTSQIPRWAYGAAGAVALYLAYRSWKLAKGHPANGAAT